MFSFPSRQQQYQSRPDTNDGENEERQTLLVTATSCTDTADANHDSNDQQEPPNHKDSAGAGSNNNNNNKNNPSGSYGSLLPDSWREMFNNTPATAMADNGDFDGSVTSTNTGGGAASSTYDDGEPIILCGGRIRLPISLRRVALELSLYVNLLITLTKFIAYLQTLSLSVLAALLDSVLDVVSQLVLSYTERHSTMQRSSAFYPAGASRLEPIGVLTCAALMGMASFEVLKESFVTLIYHNPYITNDDLSLASFWSMASIVFVKLLLLALCHKAANKKQARGAITGGAAQVAMQLADPTMEALALDHWNDALSNAIAAGALLFALRSPLLWFLDPVGAILISLYIIYSWYMTGREQIEHLTGKAAPEEFIEEIMEIATNFDDRMTVDCLRAYHFGPKFLVEIEMVMAKNTLLYESHDLGMELQYEIEALDDVERCFVHIDYETRPYDEHVVSKVPELREKYRPGKNIRSASSV